jgi:hypothetical protein
LSVLAAKHRGPMNMNRNSAYELQWAKFAEISRDSQADSKREPIDRKYAPWVHAMFSLPHEKIEEAFLVRKTARQTDHESPICWSSSFLANCSAAISLLRNILRS